VLSEKARADGPIRSAAADVAGASHVDQMLKGLRAAGLKMTPQRIAIVRQIAADDSHPSAQELFDRLKPSSPSMSFATVYNTLAALGDAGLVVSFSLAPGSTRFDPNMRPHDHAVCDGCGAVRDVVGETARLPSASSVGSSSSAMSAMSAVGFEVRSVERILRGLCLTCAHVSRASHHP
jgi:Fe2+ or Zn2+ uptake regulation protein